MNFETIEVIEYDKVTIMNEYVSIVIYVHRRIFQLRKRVCRHKAAPRFHCSEFLFRPVLLCWMVRSLHFCVFYWVAALDFDCCFTFKIVTYCTSSSAMAERPRELDQRFQVGVNLRLHYRLNGYFSRHCDMTQFTLTHHMVNKPFLLLGLVAKYRSLTVAVINFAADHKMFVTLTGERS